MGTLGALHEAYDGECSRGCGAVVQGVDRADLHEAYAKSRTLARTGVDI